MGKGGGKQHTPKEERDNLKSQQKIQIVDLLSEGPIEGPVGDLQGVLLNDTPAINGDSSVNFNGLTVEWRSGTQDQTVLEGFAESGSEAGVNVEVKKATPVTRTITSANIDMLRVTVGTPALQNTTKEGDRLRTSVKLDIQTERNGAWSSEAQVVIDGKTTSPYERAVLLKNLPPRPFNVRVVRMTDDSTTDMLQNKTSWVSYTEIIAVRQRYPNSAIVGVTALADYFGGQIPRRNYHIRGRVLQVPDNYDPATRQYNGIWQGRFKPAWSDNPAWVMWDVLTHKRYGLGKRIGATDVDKWSLYAIAQYCDSRVPDGFGATEPRMRLNANLNQARPAHDVIADLCSVIRAMPIWNGTQVTFVQDRPADSAWIYTNSNVAGGLFSYTFSALKDRHNAVFVRWTDPANGWQTSTEYVSDDAAISQYGYNPLTVDAFGCTSRGQAHRFGLWIITTEKLEIQTVTFSTGAEGLRHLPGDIFEIADNDYSGVQLGGRVLAVDTGKHELTLDREVTLPAGQTYITLPGSDGQPVRLIVDKQLQPDRLRIADLPSTVQPGAVWGLSLPALSRRLFRCVAISEKSDGTFDITGLQHVPEKEAIVDNGAVFTAQPGTTLTSRIPAVEHLSAEMNTVADGYRVDTSWDTPRVVNGLHFEVRVLRENREVMRFTTADTLTTFILHEQGQYTLEVCGLGSQGERGEPASVTLVVQAPPVPTSVDIVAGYFQLTAIPRLGGYSLHTQFEFWFSDQKITDTQTITSAAIYLGTGTLWVHDNLLPGTSYWFYVRSVNAVGRSGFVEATGTPRNDAEGMLPIFREKIDKSWFGQEFYKAIDNSELQEDFTRIEKTVTDTKSEIEQTVNKRLGDQTSTIEQIQEVQTAAGNKLNAMWSVKLQQTADGRLYMAGLGVGMENTPDGMQSQILMEADRIAMINPADGNTTPMFVAQNNQLIMNDVFLKNLYAASITSSGNPPSFMLTPDGHLTARQADITGAVNATSGHFSNVVVDGSCDVQHLRAEVIDGDISTPYFLHVGDDLTVPAGRYRRAVVVEVATAIGVYYDVTTGGINDHTTTHQGTSSAVLYVNGQRTVLAESSANIQITGSWYAYLDGGQSMLLQYRHESSGVKGGGVSPFIIVKVCK